MLPTYEDEEGNWLDVERVNVVANAWDLLDTSFWCCLVAATNVGQVGGTSECILSVPGRHWPSCRVCNKARPERMMHECDICDALVCDPKCIMRRGRRETCLRCAADDSDFDDELVHVR